MALQAPLHNKIHALLLAISLLIAACSNKNKTPNLSPVNIAANNVEVKNGVYYYNKQPFTGCLFALDEPNGDTLFRGTYVDGKEDGMHKKWYPNGQLAENRFFGHGLKTGIHRGFWPNGRIRFQYSYRHDLYEGPQYQWYESGAMYSCKNYSKGQENGMQQQWNSLGKLTINYQSLNGRQYGNIGKKNCASMWMDSIYRKPHR